MDYMRELPDKFADLAICDPPYGIDGDKGVQKNEGKYGFKKHKSTNWDSSIPSEAYFIELFRVSKNQIIWGGNFFTDFLQPSPCWVIWDKMQTDFSFSDFEMAWTSFDTKCRKFDLIRGFDETGKHYSTNNGRIHQTQKPTMLYKWLLKNYAKKGDKILDTHLGSQSSRIAAFDMGFDFTGYELDKDYFESGNKRFNQHKSQLKIFY